MYYLSILGTARNSSCTFSTPCPFFHFFPGFSFASQSLFFFSLFYPQFLYHYDFFPIILKLKVSPNILAKKVWSDSVKWYPVLILTRLFFTIMYCSFPCLHSSKYTWGLRYTPIGVPLSFFEAAFQVLHSLKPFLTLIILISCGLTFWLSIKIVEEKVSWYWSTIRNQSCQLSYFLLGVHLLF